VGRQLVRRQLWRLELWRLELLDWRLLTYTLVWRGRSTLMQGWRDSLLYNLLLRLGFSQTSLFSFLNQPMFIVILHVFIFPFSLFLWFNFAWVSLSAVMVGGRVLLDGRGPGVVVHRPALLYTLISTYALSLNIILLLPLQRLYNLLFLLCQQVCRRPLRWRERRWVRGKGRRFLRRRG